MNTERLLLGPNEYEKSIARAAELLKDGGVVAVPTETVYGLAASAYCEDAVKKVFDAKGRPQDNPLIVHIADMDMFFEIAEDIPENALICAKKFWPGPFTMVLKRTDKIPPSVSAGLDTVAVRMPSDPVCRDIIRKSGIPLAAPSANLSGKPSPTEASHVLCDLDGKIDAVVISGSCDVGVESTVVAFTGNTPSLLRPGGVTLEQLREILPDITVDSAVLSEPEKGAKVASPGMKYKHYAPKAETYLVEADGEKYADYVNGINNGIAICFSEEEDAVTTKKIVYGSRQNEATLAHSVFDALREADALGAETVYVHAPSKTGVGLAVYNRLIRAAAFRVIKL